MLTTVTPETYQFFSEPYAKQREIFLASADLPFAALFMEQRTGKTKVTIDTIAYQHEADARVDAAVIFADNGLHRQWIEDELPKHWPLGRIPYQAIAWHSGRASTKRFQEALTQAAADSRFFILAMNTDAVITSRAKEWLEKILRWRKVFMVVDESTSIGNPGAQRTKSIVALGRRAVSRRILSGTPVAEGPLKLYSQGRFLSDRYHGYKSFVVYRSVYAILRPMTLNAGGRTIQVVEGYQRLDELKQRIAPFTFWLQRSEMYDLPPKNYDVRRFELATGQRRLYDKLRDEYIYEFRSQPELQQDLVTNVLTRWTRLQQLACGFVVNPDWPHVHAAPKYLATPDNARLALLYGMVELEFPKDRTTIIWCRFEWDVDHVLQTIKSLGRTAVRYDGQVSPDDRVANKRAFLDGKAQFFVGTPRTGGRGLTLNNASTVLFYSNNFPLEWRLQAEDRPIHKDNPAPITVIDLVADDTIDQRILKAHVAKMEVSSLLRRGATPEELFR